MPSAVHAQDAAQAQAGRQGVRRAPSPHARRAAAEPWTHSPSLVHIATVRRPSLLLTHARAHMRSRASARAAPPRREDSDLLQMLHDADTQPQVPVPTAQAGALGAPRAQPGTSVAHSGLQPPANGQGLSRGAAARVAAQQAASRQLGHGATVTFRASGAREHGQQTFRQIAEEPMLAQVRSCRHAHRAARRAARRRVDASRAACDDNRAPIRRDGS